MDKTDADNYRSDDDTPDAIVRYHKFRRRLRIVLIGSILVLCWIGIVQLARPRGPAADCVSMWIKGDDPTSPEFQARFRECLERANYPGFHPANPSK